MRRNQFKNRDWNDPKWQDELKEYQEHRQRNKVFFGIAVAMIGVLWIFKSIFNIPFDWDLQWPYVVIAVGLLIGLKNNFRNSAWWILCLVGGGNLVEMYAPLHREIVWASILIVVGLIIAFRPRKNNCTPRFKMDRSISAENNLNIDITFGGRKEMITSKNFSSGNVSVTFGGCELNFMQADFEGTAILDLRVSFGGVEIIVPAHWHIQNEINPSFGNVEDERNIQTSQSIEVKRTLILRGNCAFGNVEIKSY